MRSKRAGPGQCNYREILKRDNQAITPIMHRTIVVDSLRVLLRTPLPSEQLSLRPDCTAQQRIAEGKRCQPQTEPRLSWPFCTRNLMPGKSCVCWPNFWSTWGEREQHKPTVHLVGCVGSMLRRSLDPETC